MAELLGLKDWKCSNGFLYRFCMRYGVLSKKICGEGLDCPDYSTFMNEVLRPLLQEYEPQDIYNADETALFFKALANRTYAFRSEQVRGSKATQSKDRLSLLLCTNMTGTDKLKPVLIGKAARPSCLRKKGVSLKDLKVDYYHNKNGWMTSVIFEDWLSQWNKLLCNQRRHVLLLIDNAPSHVTREYSNIKIQFLPPNTTAKIQPLDQGVLRICKLHYRKILNTEYLDGIERQEDAKKILKGFDFILACDAIVKSWDLVKESFIEKCFSKAGLISSVTPEPEPEPAPPCNIWDNIQHALDVDVSFEEYALADDNIETQRHMTDGDIVQAVQLHSADEQPEEDGDDDDESDAESEISDAGSTMAALEGEIIHTTNDCMRTIGQMKAFALRNKLPVEATVFLDNFQHYVLANRINTCTKQSNIFNFFKR